MESKDPIEKLRRRVRRMKWAPLVPVGFAVITAITGFSTYNQGREINREIDDGEYGTLFWSGVNTNETYDGMNIYAEHLYSTSALHIGGNAVGITFAVIAFMVRRRDIKLLAFIDETLGEQSRNRRSG